MKRLLPFLIVLSVLFLSFIKPYANPAQGHRTLAIGSAAPEINLPATDGKTYSLASFKTADVLAIIFTCNHCPTVQAYEDRMIQLTKDYGSKGVKVIAIMPNDPRAIRLDELGYTDMSDSFEEMKRRGREKKYNFTYLYDGATQDVSKAYGPVATPHIFIFDRNRKLAYQGRIDNMEKPGKTPDSLDARNALDALLAKKQPAVTITKVFGCSVKWAEKSDWMEKAAGEWAKEPVNLAMIDVNGVKELLKNKTDKLRLINVWATWCAPCIAEYAEFITMNRMYRRRDFEFISISTDDPAKKTNVLKFLQSKQSSVSNYLFSIDDKYQLVEALDPKWPGALPYTVLVEPGGKIVYARQGGINPAQMKKLIVENSFIGRYK